MGDTYGATSVNVSAMAGTAGAASPRSPGSGGGMRHAAACEEVCPALHAIADALDALGDPAGNTAQIRQLADASLMKRNMGE